MKQLELALQLFKVHTPRKRIMQRVNLVGPAKSEDQVKHLRVDLVKHGYLTKTSDSVRVENAKRAKIEQRIAQIARARQHRPERIAVPSRPTVEVVVPANASREEEIAAINAFCAARPPRPILPLVQQAQLFLMQRDFIVQPIGDGRWQVDRNIVESDQDLIKLANDYRKRVGMPEFNPAH